MTNLTRLGMLLRQWLAVEGAVVLCRMMNTAKPMQGLIKSLKSELNSYAL